MSALLEIDDVHRSFGALRAVDGVSLSVTAGRTLGIVGESGCGKSTTARLALRLLEPSAGAVRFDGRDLATLDRRGLAAFRRDAQMVFQDPYSSLNPRKTVGAAIAQPLRHHGIEPDARKRTAAVQTLMERVGLNPEHFNRYPHEFSGGQRQRIGIARAMASRPRLIVADEPVSALDVSIQAQILNLMRGLRREMGLTIVFIAHDLSVVRHMCDDVAVMYLGRVVERAPAREVFTRPRHPYTAALLDAMPVPDPDAVHDGEPLSGDVPSPLEPPPGCRFHTRCPRAAQRCLIDDPPLEAGVACHYPLASSPG